TPFAFHSTLPPRSLPPFPTRRSSDLIGRPRLRRFHDPIALLNQDPGERRAQLFTGVPRTIRGEPIEVGHDDAHVRLTRQNRTSRSEEHTSELQSPDHLVCRLLLEKKN